MDVDIIVDVGKFDHRVKSDDCGTSIACKPSNTFAVWGKHRVLRLVYATPSERRQYFFPLFRGPNAHKIVITEGEMCSVRRKSDGTEVAPGFSTRQTCGLCALLNRSNNECTIFGRRSQPLVVWREGKASYCLRVAGKLEQMMVAPMLIEINAIIFGG